eukprot:GHVT01002728.1.p2 GENE.GHVT01002728.1~~GHVT01002728.1.p2  ORF type:complete len:111 (-),score=28.16 GHVT01002728.1:840-1172(-)
MSALFFPGVALDEPMGHSDGRDVTAQGRAFGRALFQCQGPKYALFATPADVRFGDFPPFDPLADESDDQAQETPEVQNQFERNSNTRGTSLTHQNDQRHRSNQPQEVDEF